MEKRGLGRGLAALIPEAAGGDRNSGVREIPMDQIKPNPYQPRIVFDPVALADLEQSIREHGVLQPILVREIAPGRFQIVAGERRFRAASNVGLKEIAVIVKECSDRELLEIALVENVQREDISAIEAARAYARMAQEFGMTQDMIAQRVGKSRPTIANTMRLLSLPLEVQNSVERGEISEGHGRALIAAEDPASILKAWRAVLKRGLSVRETERLAKEMRNGDHSSASADLDRPRPSAREQGTGLSGFDPNEARLVDDLQEALQTKVILKQFANGSGKIEIEFYSSDELERLADLLKGAGTVSRSTN